MQVAILAGGLGTRLRPLTREVPKPMVPVRGVPYLAHQLRYCIAHGFTDVVLLTGYLGEQVEDYFGDGARLGLRIRYSREPEPIGTGGALKLARALLDEQFLLIYGDSFLPIDYARVVARLDETHATGCVVVYDNRLADTSVLNNIALTPNDMVRRYDKTKTPDAALTHVEAGVLAFRRAVLDLIPAGKVSLEEQVFPRLIATGQLAAFSTRQRFYDIGTPERLRAFEEYLAT